MDDHQRDVLQEAVREAYLCLRDRNRPQVMVEGQLLHADAELAAALRLVARQLFVMQAECDRLAHELEPLLEARFSGALDRILDTVAQVHESEVGGWPGRRATRIIDVQDTDLQQLRALAAEREPNLWRAG